jgi:hypothetical protein
MRALTLIPVRKLTHYLVHNAHLDHCHKYTKKTAGTRLIQKTARKLIYFSKPNINSQQAFILINL